MAKKQFAPPVTNFSVSCDPALVKWLNDYAHKKRTSRSKLVRKALIDFRAEHMDEPDVNAPIIDAAARCIICDAAVIRSPGQRALCIMSSAHVQESNGL
jgi:metal-responsive CopG/Arc/MetJ family transcriptional regulator